VGGKHNYGILKFGRFWRTGVCITGRIQRVLSSIASRNYTPNTNAIVVTIRISIADLIAGVGAATKTFAPGGKHPRAATDYNYAVCWLTGDQCC